MMTHRWVDVNDVLRSERARWAFTSDLPTCESKQDAETALYEWLKRWAHELYYPKHVGLFQASIERGVHVRSRLVVEPVGHGRILQPCAVMTTDLVGLDGEPIWIEAGKSALAVDVAWFAWKPL